MSYKHKGRDLRDTPMIPATVYNNLPQFLKDCCEQLKTPREKDVCLTGSFGLLGACLPNIQGRYKEGTLHPNLYTIVAAPAASGKGTLQLVKLLGIPLHNHLSAVQIAEVQEGETTEGREDEKKEPTVPKSLILPADSSAAMFVELLFRNGGTGIIFETEVDTLVNTLKQDWGLLDDKLRKSFHHEAISLARKTDKTVIHINRPKLSMVMSGTIDQVVRLIRSPENGLFSRIIFYVYRQDFVWSSAKPDYQGISPEEFFLKKGQELVEIYKHFEVYPAEFSLTSEQWDKLDNFFAPLMKAYPEAHGDDAAGVVARMGVITFRIAMILSALRRWEGKHATSTIGCTDQDFTSALELGKVYAQHSMIMIGLLPQTSQVNSLKEKDNLYPLLPLSFTRSEAISIGAKAKYAERSVGRWLSEWLEEGKLTQPKQGHYKKPQ